MGTDSLYYIMDYSGHYYRTNQAEQLVAAAGEQEATVFTLAQANRHIGVGKKASFYCMVPIEEQTESINPTSMASQMIFEGNAQQIHDVLAQLEQKVDNRSNNEKRERVDIEVDGTKMQIKAEPVTERIATELTDETDYGGIIYADVQSPDEAIADIDKYEYLPFTENLLDRVWESLRKIGDLVADGESISQALRNYLDARKKINKYRLRLQDAPMFPVLADKGHVIKLFTLSDKISKFYEEFFLILRYCFLPDKSIFVCTGFNFCTVNKNGLA